MRTTIIKKLAMFLLMPFLLAVSLIGVSCGTSDKAEIAELRQDIQGLEEQVTNLNKGLNTGALDPDYELLRSIGMLHSNIHERNYEIMGEALSKFNPALRRYLALIPVITGDVETAVARTRRYEPPLNVYSIVSRDWDNTHGESVFWYSVYQKRGEDKNKPVFSRFFKLTLIIHEYLHHAELKAGIDMGKFLEEVTVWYNDPAWGEPTPESNYQKFLLFWNVYGGNGELNGHIVPGSGEFAFIGEAIAISGKERLEELPSNIIAYYHGILRKDLLYSR